VPRTKPELSVVRVRLDDILPALENAVTHGEGNIEAIVASLAEFGQASPLLLQRSSGRLIAGHGRLEAMRRLGWEHCDVTYLDVDDDRAAALSLALNRTGELRKWDPKALARMLKRVRDAGLNADATGFNREQVELMLSKGRTVPLQAPAPKGESSDGTQTVQLFYRKDELKEFMELGKGLMPVLAADNLSQVVLACLRRTAR
jgi:ParB-like chromosome segregation protein Spo0J